jgi:hypothetical protein
MVQQKRLAGAAGLGSPEGEMSQQAGFLVN